MTTTTKLLPPPTIAALLVMSCATGRAPTPNTEPCSVFDETSELAFSVAETRSLIDDCALDRALGEPSMRRGMPATLRLKWDQEDRLLIVRAALDGARPSLTVRVFRSESDPEHGQRYVVVRDETRPLTVDEAAAIAAEVRAGDLAATAKLPVAAGVDDVFWIVEYADPTTAVRIGTWSPQVTGRLHRLGRLLLLSAGLDVP